MDTDVLQIASDYVSRGAPCALCTVVRASGSVPRHAGSKLLVDREGAIVAGSVGGGEMESRVLDTARQAIRDGRPKLVSYQLADPRSGDPGVCGGSVDVFVEPLLPAPVLVVAGAGHVGRALAHLARWLGFRVIVSDDRVELCTPEAFPEADAHLAGPLAEQLQRLELDERTYVALVTRGSPLDAAALPLLLSSRAAYIGVIGSRKRWLETARALAEAGVGETELARVHTPIGLEIGAETPEEIAVSIMAEIIAARHGL